jgi:transaldolase
MTEEGLVAVRRFSAEGIKTNVTLIFNPIQALMAAKAGATFVSPFVGRLDDISTNGMEMVAQIQQIFSNYGFKTETLVASVRHPVHILDAALMGADVVTVPYKVLEQLTKHPLTDQGIDKFLKDWESSRSAHA